MSDTKKRVFLCHSTKDKPFVEQLKKDLEKRDFNCWIDRIEIRGGDSLLEKISKGIESCDVFLAFLSENSINSHWVQFELEQAMHKEIEGKNFKVIPLCLDDCKIPEYLKHLHYRDFRDYNCYKDVLDELEIDIGTDTQNFKNLKKYQETLNNDDLIHAYVEFTKDKHVSVDHIAVFTAYRNEFVHILEKQTKYNFNLIDLDNIFWQLLSLRKVGKLPKQPKKSKISKNKVKSKISELERKILDLFYSQFRQTPGNWIQKKHIRSLISLEEISDIDFEATINYLEQKQWIVLHKIQPNSWQGVITPNGIEEVEKK